MSKKRNINTILAQAGIKSDQATGALTTPLHFSTTYQHPEFGQSTGFDYTRTKNPTRATAEKTLAAIESADYALATSSGMSAIVLAFSIFPVGSKVLAVRDLYGGSFRWFNQQEQEGRFSFTYANTEEELIHHLAKLAHAKGAKVVVDNTFYSPIYQRPIEEGADIVLHSATKYLAGHNDVLAGVVVTNDADLYDKLFYNLNTTGAVLSPFDSYLLIRGLKTLSIRMERSTENARKVVEFLKTSPQVKEVLYTGKGGMVSFKIQDEKKIPNLLNSLQVFTFAESLGGVESLITYPTTQTHADIPAEVRHSYGLTDDLLRLSIGIEDADDLIEDLKQALEA